MKLLNKIDKNTRTFIGVLAVVFSIMILLSNPMSFTEIPSKISAFGLILLILGVWLVYDANI